MREGALVAPEHVMCAVGDASLRVGWGVLTSSRPSAARGATHEGATRMMRLR